MAIIENMFDNRTFHAPLPREATVAYPCCSVGERIG